MADKVVRVTPSMTEEAPKAVISSAEALGLSGLKSTHGIELLQDEVEEFSCEFVANGRITDGFWKRLLDKIKYYATCQPCCQCYIPTSSSSVRLLVTNKRLVLRSKRLDKKPGIKRLGYYLTCMCLCARSFEGGHEEQICIHRKDIKDYWFEIKEDVTTQKCLCCIWFQDVKEQFTMEIFQTKTIGETRMGWQTWALDKDVKTYRSVQRVEGFMPKLDSAQLRAVLHALVAQNTVAAAAQPLPVKAAVLN